MPSRSRSSFILTDIRGGAGEDFAQDFGDRKHHQQEATGQGGHVGLVVGRFECLFQVTELVQRAARRAAEGWGASFEKLDALLL